MKIKQEKNQNLVLNMFKFRTSRVSYVDQNADGAINDNVVSKQDSYLFSLYWWHLTNSTACGSYACGDSYYIWSEFFGSPHFSDSFQI